MPIQLIDDAGYGGVMSFALCWMKNTRYLMLMVDGRSQAATAAGNLSVPTYVLPGWLDLSVTPRHNYLKDRTVMRRKSRSVARLIKRSNTRLQFVAKVSDQQTSSATRT
jgi:hypothetical protein